MPPESLGDRLIIKELRAFIQAAERGTVVKDDPRHLGVELRRIFVHPDTIERCRRALKTKRAEYTEDTK